MRTVRDDPGDPDPGFADLYASLPDATDLEPWLGWCRQARGPVLYLGVGVGRLAVPLHMGGVVSEIYPGSTWIRKFVAAIAALMVSGMIRLAESMVTQAHGI